MNKYFYNVEDNILIILSLLKQFGIKKVIASPGATNITLVASMQQDSYFEMYSCVDERSAAYMACGLSEESGEPVVLTCTGATASRNYMPGLTEAYYRKLPILVITSSQDSNKIGHLFPQVTDRTQLPTDIVVASFQLPFVKDEDDKWSNIVKVNQAINDLRYNEGGPVHINLITRYTRDYSVKELPSIKKIDKICYTSDMPRIESDSKIAIFISSHHVFNSEQIDAIDRFCSTHNAVVFCDSTSNYFGKYRVFSSLIFAQENIKKSTLEFDLLIHLGEMSGDYYTRLKIIPKEVWRISKDGMFRDSFRRLTKLFCMDILDFFNYYKKGASENKLYSLYLSIYTDLYNNIPDLPFSDLWIAQTLSKMLPQNTVLHTGILNSLRCWNFFDCKNIIRSNSNVGGFGIDGCVSSLIGASFVHPKNIYLGVFGDLAFFYDINCLGNREFGNNIRILLVNNGKGAEFRHYNNDGSQFGEDTDKYIAAAGHNGNKSNLLVKHFTEDLGFKYLSASNKEDFLNVVNSFVVESSSKPIILEVFTDSINESEALFLLRNIQRADASMVVKNTVRKTLGDSTISKLKNFLKK